jgi:hypothetical protein
LLRSRRQRPRRRTAEPSDEFAPRATICPARVTKNGLLAQLGLLHDLVPRAATIAVLSDPRTRSQANRLQDARDATAALGQKLLVLEASTADEIDAQFASLDREPADAMLVASLPKPAGS